MKIDDTPEYAYYNYQGVLILEYTYIYILSQFTGSVGMCIHLWYRVYQPLFIKIEKVE